MTILLILIDITLSCALIYTTIQWKKAINLAKETLDAYAKSVEFLAELEHRLDEINKK